MNMSLETVLFGVLPVLAFVLLAARSAYIGRRREQRDDGPGEAPAPGRHTGPQHTDQTRGDG